MSNGKHLLGILFTAMVLVSIPILAITGWQVTGILVQDGSYIGAVLLLAVIAIHGLGIVLFGYRLLTRASDRSVALALFVSLVIPTTFGLGAGWKYLTQAPPSPPHIDY